MLPGCNRRVLITQYLAPKTWLKYLSGIEMIEIYTPISEEVVKQLKVGDNINETKTCNRRSRFSCK